MLGVNQRELLAALTLTQLCAASLFSLERLPTRGRRLSIQGNWLAVTAPERERVALYDVSGEQPRKVGEFGGEQGLDPGQTMGPHGALLLPPDELVVADTFNGRIESFDLPAALAGRRPAFRRVAGRPGRGPGEFDGPMSGVASSNDAALAGLLFVADTRNQRIQVLDSRWRFVREIGSAGEEPGKLAGPAAMAFDPSGRVLYVAEEFNQRLSAFDGRTGALVFTFTGCPDEPLAVPVGLAVAADGDVLVTDRVRRRLLRLRPEPGADGRPRGLRCAGGFGRYGIGAGEWQYPQAVAVDGRGRLYVCDQADDRCQIFSGDGRLLGRFADDWQSPEWVPPVGEAKHDPGGPRLLCSAAGTFGVRVETDPSPMPLNEPFDLKVALTAGCDPGAAPAEDVTLRVSGLMPEHRHGMNSEPRTRGVGAGRFEVAGALLHMPGLWELYFDISHEGVLERAQMALDLE